MKENHNIRGSLLVAVIWALVIFGILGAGLFSITSSWLRTAKFLEERVESEFSARAAFNYALAQINNDETVYDTLKEFREVKEKTLGLAGFSYTVTDEESKLNINTASRECLARLQGLDSDTAQKIRESTLRPYDLKEELLFVDGVNREAYDNIKDCITTQGSGAVNINTVSFPVMVALGLSQELAERIVQYRAGADGIEGDEDDGCFENPSSVIETLKDVTGLYGQDESILKVLISQGKLVVSSEYLTLEITTKMPGRETGKYFVTLDNGRIKQWREL
jgi:type II secretory pathway component PulK